MLRVGIPKEIKPLEKRVGLTPAAVRRLCEQGIEVVVQQQAGAGCGYSDEDYQKAGANLVPDLAAVYAQADLIQKVKEPLAPEFPLLRTNQILFCFLHLASPENCRLVDALTRSGVTAIGYETLEKDGRLPLLAPMSEIAGTLAAAYAAALQQMSLLKVSKIDSSEVLRLLETTASRYPQFNLPSPGKVVIFGGGVAGFRALEAALEMKADVMVIEKDPQRREFLKRFCNAVFSPEEKMKPRLEKADVLIGCVHSKGKRALRVLEEKIFREICRKKNKIIVDVAIDQGGNFPESRPTAYPEAVYFDSLHNLRFGVANMPSLCGRGASEALSAATECYTAALAKDPKLAFEKFPELAGAINVQSGVIKIPAVREAHRK